MRVAMLGCGDAYGACCDIVMLQCYDNIPTQVSTIVFLVLSPMEAQPV
jgi:hypothetical protein